MNIYRIIILHIKVQYNIIYTKANLKYTIILLKNVRSVILNLVPLVHSHLYILIFIKALALLPMLAFISKPTLPFLKDPCLRFVHHPEFK